MRIKIKKIQVPIMLIATIVFIWITFDVFNQTSISFGNIDFEIGSKYGTLIAGVLSFVSILLLWINLKIQSDSTSKSDFENRFFKLISYHKENVKSFTYKDPSSAESNVVQGQRVFINIHREILRAISILQNELKIKSLDQILNRSEVEKLLNVQHAFEREIINLAYLIVYYGVGKKEEREIIRNKLSERCEPIKIEPILKAFQDEQAVWDVKSIGNKKRIENDNHYKFFGGHQHRLAHYFRHFIHTVKYVNDSDLLKGQYKLKYEYIKIFRSQFSNYEQAVLFYNSLSILGENWEFGIESKNDKLITKYNLIKNIPLDLIKEFKLKNHYPNVSYENDDYPTGRYSLKSKYK